MELQWFRLHGDGFNLFIMGLSIVKSTAFKYDNAPTVSVTSINLAFLVPSLGGKLTSEKLQKPGLQTFRLVQNS